MNKKTSQNKPVQAKIGSKISLKTKTLLIIAMAATLFAGYSFAAMSVKNLLKSSNNQKGNAVSAIRDNSQITPSEPEVPGFNLGDQKTIILYARNENLEIETAYKDSTFLAELLGYYDNYIRESSLNRASVSFDIGPELVLKHGYIIENSHWIASQIMQEFEDRNLVDFSEYRRIIIFYALENNDMSTRGGLLKNGLLDNYSGGLHIQQSNQWNKWGILQYNAPCSVDEAGNNNCLTSNPFHRAGALRNALGVIKHEMGHTMGAKHANRIMCKKNGQFVTLSRKCEYFEYGNPFDPMGGSINYEDINDYFIFGRYFSPSTMRFFGWLKTNESIVVGSGVHTIYPISSGAEHLFEIRVPYPGRNYEYSIEYRSQVGLDSRIGFTGILISVARARIDQVTNLDFDDYYRLIDPLYSDEVADEQSPYIQGFTQSLLLDLKPNSYDDPDPFQRYINDKFESQLESGESFCDPNTGVKITFVETTQDGGASINVGTCPIINNEEIN